MNFSQETFVTEDATEPDYMANGPILKNGNNIMKGVIFSTVANNDIHISISKSNPVDPENSWEIVLGGWSGEKSVIRKSHKGENLVEIEHSKEQFIKVKFKVKS